MHEISATMGNSPSHPNPNTSETPNEHTQTAHQESILDNDLVALRWKLHASNTSARVGETTIAALHLQLEKLNAQHADLQSVCQRQTAELKQRNSELIDRGQVVEVLTLDRDRLRALAGEAQVKLETSINDARTLQQSNTKLANELARVTNAYAKMAADFSDTTGEATRLRAAKDATDQENDRRSANLERLETSNSNLTSEIAEHRAAQTKLQAKLQDATAAASESKAATAIAELKIMGLADTIKTFSQEPTDERNARAQTSVDLQNTATSTSTSALEAANARLSAGAMILQEIHARLGEELMAALRKFQVRVEAVLEEAMDANSGLTSAKAAVERDLARALARVRELEARYCVVHPMQPCKANVGRLVESIESQEGCAGAQLSRKF